jgi:hypothetical protein
VHAFRVLAPDLEPGVALGAAGGVECEEVHAGSAADLAGRSDEPAFDQSASDVQQEWLFGVRGYQHLDILPGY